MSFGSELAASVAGLTAEFGRQCDVTLHRIASSDHPGAYNSATGVISGEEVDDEALSGAVFMSYRASLVDGVNVLQGDQRCMFTADCEFDAPLPGDQIEVVERDGNGFEAGSRLYSVVSVQMVEVSGRVVKHECQVRNV